jgi:hypothetical protein
MPSINGAVADEAGIEDDGASGAIAAATKAVVAIRVVLSAAGGVVDKGEPVKVGEAIGAPPAAVTSFRISVTAPVRPLKVETPEGAETIAAITNAVVATWVVLVEGAAVGAVGTPVKAGLASTAPPAAEMSLAIRLTAPERPLNDVTPVLKAAISDST